MLLYQFQLVILLIKRFFVSILNPSYLDHSRAFHLIFLGQASCFVCVRFEFLIPLANLNKFLSLFLLLSFSEFKTLQALLIFSLEAHCHIQYDAIYIRFENIQNNAGYYLWLYMY